MLNTLEILDANIEHLIILGCDDVNVSMPVLHRDADGKMCLATFSWNSINKKQRNVPKPEHVLITPLSGGTMRVEEVPECGLPSVCTARPMSTWTQKALARDLDEIIQDYLSTGDVEIYKYLFYLENMLTNYDQCYYPLFRELNLPELNIDVLRS